MKNENFVQLKIKIYTAKDQWFWRFFYDKEFQFFSLDIIIPFKFSNN